MVLKRLFKKWARPKNEHPEGQLTKVAQTIIPRSEHSVSRQDISENALKVLYRLKKHGYSAYLVGGGVRDVLLGFHPKDFDIVTNAKPEEIKRVFNNCRLIGRRFRLAHIFYGRDIIEVATFRGKGSIAADAITSDQGMILSDNVYGTLEEDVWRRDFTLNALYYNIKDFSLVDFCGGLEDLKARTLRMIGEPTQRFTEDPVRMLRAIRLSCKLNLKLDEALPKAIKDHAHLLSHVSEARLYEEVLKLFHSGAGVSSYEQLQAHDLFYKLFPLLETVSNPEQASDFVKRVLRNTDHRISVKKPVNPAFIFSAFLWYPLQEVIATIQEEGLGYFPAMGKAADHVLRKQRNAVSIPKRHALAIKEIWLMQVRLERRQARRVEKLSQEPRFRAAYDFLLLRGEVGEQVEAAKWWESYVDGTPQMRGQALKQLHGGKAKTRKKKPKNKKPGNDTVE